MPSRAYGSYSNTGNNSLFKFALAAASFFAGALVGAYAPDLILKPGAAAASRALVSREGDEQQEPGAAAPLCVGPECASVPPAKLPSTLLPLSPPSPYHAARLMAVRKTAASSASVAELEQYSLLLDFLYLHSPPSAALYSDAQESLPSLVAHLSSLSFTVTPTSALSLASLRGHLNSQRLPLVAVQSGGESRWLAVVALDAFYVYLIDPYSPCAVGYVETREFVKQWWSLDEDSGRRVLGEALIVQAGSPAVSSATAGSGSTRLTRLRLEAAAEEHPAVEGMASL